MNDFNNTADLRILLDCDTNQKFYPYTHEKAVVDANGNNVIGVIKKDLSVLNEAINVYKAIEISGITMNRSNAHTLDWYGNAWYQGDVECRAIILKSSTAGSTKRFKITVDDSGTIKATEV